MKKILIVAFILLVIVVVYVRRECFVVNGAAMARVYCPLLDDRESY